jgi:putative membrane protein (TIGR04086 family)
MSYNLEFKNNNLLNILVGTLVGIIITFLSLLLFSVVYTYLDIPEHYNAVFATVSLIVGSYFGGRLAVSKINEKGYLYGALVGALIFMVVFVCSLLISRNSISLTSLFHFLGSVISGCIAGIIRANKETNKKYLK